MQLFKDFGLYSVDLNYLSYLYSNDSEVMHSSYNNYEDKPFRHIDYNLRHKIFNSFNIRQK